MELVILMNCPNPPTNLKHNSFYWYDRTTGFWGKKGYKPSQIISANLNVGGDLDTNASSGNTAVYINGREITKLELRMLKLVGVKCHREIHFWMYEDGSYQEEGMTPMRGNIWIKAASKLICSLLSLPFPPNPKSSHSIGDYAKQEELDTVVDNRVLLIGSSASAMTTFFNQAKFLYRDVPFSDDELNSIKLLIRQKVCGYFHIIFQAHLLSVVKSLRKSQSSDDQGFLGYSPRLKEISEWLQSTECLDFSLTSSIQKYGLVIMEVWKDTSFQRTLKRTRESKKLRDAVMHFLKRATDIFDPNYEPSHMDILCLEDFPTTVCDMNFSFILANDDDTHYDDENIDKLLRFQLITTPKEWFKNYYECLDMFDDARIVIFGLSLTDYDQFVLDERGTYVNKLILNRMLFENVATNPILANTYFLLLITDYDLFEQKIEHSPLNRCDLFQEFQPVIGISGKDLGSSPGDKAFHYISSQFKKLYAAATGRRLYVTKVNCLDQHSVDSALKYAREVLNWDVKSTCFLEDYYSSSEESCYSDEDV